MFWEVLAELKKLSAEELLVLLSVVAWVSLRVVSVVKKTVDENQDLNVRILGREIIFIKKRVDATRRTQRVKGATPQDEE